MGSEDAAENAGETEEDEQEEDVAEDDDLWDWGVPSADYSTLIDSHSGLFYLAINNTGSWLCSEDLETEIDDCGQFSISHICATPNGSEPLVEQSGTIVHMNVYYDTFPTWYTVEAIGQALVTTPSGDIFSTDLYGFFEQYNGVGSMSISWLIEIISPSGTTQYTGSTYGSNEQ